MAATGVLLPGISEAAGSWNEYSSIVPCIGKLIPLGCNIASREAAVFGVTAGADEALL